MTTEFAPRSRLAAGALERGKRGNDSPWSWPHFESHGLDRFRIVRGRHGEIWTELIYGFLLLLLVETPNKKCARLYRHCLPESASFPSPPSSNMSGRGRGRGRGDRGRVGGGGKRKKRKKPSSSAADNRTEDDDSSIELAVPPSRPSHSSTSTSSTDETNKKTYRKFDPEDASFRNSLIEQAAQERIKASRDNAKNPGRLPRGFGSKQVEAFSKRVPTLHLGFCISVRLHSELRRHLHGLVISKHPSVLC